MAVVVRDNKLQQLDTLLFFKCHKLTNQFVKDTSIWVSKTGDGHAYLILASILLWLDQSWGKSFFQTALIAFAIELPIYLTLKNLVKRHRPFNKISQFSSHISPSDRFSMPSGHTAAGFVFATVLAYFYPEYAQLAYTWATLIGFSRIFLGVHFPGDIIAGAFLGYSSAQLALSLYFF